MTQSPQRLGHSNIVDRLFVDFRQTGVIKRGIMRAKGERRESYLPVIAPYEDRIENFISAGRVYTEFKTRRNNSEAVTRRW